MSRGLSKFQRDIVGAVASSFGKTATTVELLGLLKSLGWFSDREVPHSQRLFVIRRACRSLERRGLLAGELQFAEYGDGPMTTLVRTVCWSATGTLPPDPPADDPEPRAER